MREPTNPASPTSRSAFSCSASRRPASSRSACSIRSTTTRRRCRPTSTRPRVIRFLRRWRAPLKTLPRGEYRLKIAATDKLAARSVTGDVAFRMVATPATLLGHRSATVPFRREALLDVTVLSEVAARLRRDPMTPAMAAALDAAREAPVHRPAARGCGRADGERPARAALRGIGLFALGDPRMACTMLRQSRAARQRTPVLHSLSRRLPGERRQRPRRHRGMAAGPRSRRPGRHRRRRRSSMRYLRLGDHARARRRPRSGSWLAACRDPRSHGRSRRSTSPRGSELDAIPTHRASTLPRSQADRRGAVRAPACAVRELRASEGSGTTAEGTRASGSGTVVHRGQGPARGARERVARLMK